MNKEKMHFHPLIRRVAQDCVDLARRLHPGAMIREREITIARHEALRILDTWSREARGTSRFQRVLVDGQWENPNHWLRYAMLRKALKLSSATEVGLLGQWQRRAVQDVFADLGVSQVVDYFTLAKARPEHFDRAQEIIATWKNPEDVFVTRFTGEFPPSFIYDGLLSKLHVGVLDLERPELKDLVAEALAYLDAAEAVFEQADYDLICLSHHSSWTHGALAWSALRRGIPVIHIYGEFGVLRLGMMTEPDHIFSAQERPLAEEIDTLPVPRRSALERIGHDYISSRVDGRTSDLGAQLAYLDRTVAVNKNAIAQRFGWDPKQPFIGIFGHSWFDFPHSIGMSYYRDFVDWMHCTLAAVGDLKEANFLCKAHPADNWYPPLRGETLAQMVEATGSRRIAVVDESWNGGSLLSALDAVVTCHGTIAIEAAALGTPALVGHPGWFGHLGFTVTSASREDYIEKVGSRWWDQWHKDPAMERARILAGIIYCAPGWQGSYAFYDDHRQFEIYKKIIEFMTSFAREIDEEVGNILDWWESGHRYYHIYSMTTADSFVILSSLP